MNSREYTFQWTDKKGVSHRKTMLFMNEDKAWYMAFKECGWENRTSLGLVGDSKARQIRNGIIKNWWDAMNDRNLYNFNTLYLSFNLQDQLKSGFVKVVGV
jgi:hypothetical protein